MSSNDSNSRLPGPGKAHINPNFKSVSSPNTGEKCSNIHVNPSKVHINPNFAHFANRPLPPTPNSAHINPKSAHINPKFFQKSQTALDIAKQKKYDLSIQQSVAQKVFVNPKFQPNLAMKASASPVKATAISPPNDKENYSPWSGKIFKKIGTKKLIRIKQKKGVRSPYQNAKNLFVYNIKPRKNLIATPTKRKSLIMKLVTPLSLRKKKRPKFTNTSRLSLSLTDKKPSNPFKLDRRTSPPQKGKPTTTQNKQGNRKVPPAKPIRTTAVHPKRETVVNVDGVKFKVSEGGRKLCRLPDESAASPAIPATPKTGTEPKQHSTVPSRLNRKLFLEGEEYEEQEPGVLVISRNSMTRQSITNARNKSIHTIMKSQTRSKQYCMFFNKFGKCTKREKGVCPYIHDREKIAVCRKFLRGDCQKENCLLSHKAAPEKMQACKFFLEGLCTKDNCPYRHVKVNPEAQICPNYIKGFCPAGSNCKKRHVSRCPQFERTGMCVKGSNCHFPHNKDKESSNGTVKAKPPTKPKRKSINPKTTPVAAAEKTKQGDSNKKVCLRYFDTEHKVECEMIESNDEYLSTSLESKRQRLLRKVELAKQGWTGVALDECSAKRGAPTDQTVDHLDDSGPYEEIEDDIPSPARPELGELPAFIPLDFEQPTNDLADKDSFQERLI